MEGIVEVTAGGESARLAPEQAAAYRAGGRLEVRDAETAPLVAWKDHSFIFNGQSLEEIMATLSLWYDVDVVYENEEVKRTRLTGDLMRYEDIRKLLHLFEQTSGLVKFEIDGRTITIK
ncbi:MAG: DUF4974 domain-containing protein [Odoribacteraceae bacterium]|nr:DUF4974 domain-containing protein [Odoribacteraceae bacterium]